MHQEGQGGTSRLRVGPLRGFLRGFRTGFLYVRTGIRVREAVTRAWQRPFVRDEFPCHDCGLLTAPVDGPDEWYTVLDTVWEHADADEGSILCVGCLEARLGRRLRHADFVAAALNTPNYGRHSQRLLSRLRDED